MAFGKPQMKKVPVEAGKEYEIVIEDMGKGGDGIARIDGFVLFVPNAEKGSKVKVKVTAVKEKFAFAEKI